MKEVKMKNIPFSLVNIRRMLALVVSLLVLSSLAACSASPLTSAGTDGPQVTISNAVASRNSSGLPVITVGYSVKYPSDLYAQTLNSVPTLTCAMTQGQLTRNRTLTGQPVPITGISANQQTSQATIQVGDSDKAIQGTYTIMCSLSTDHPIGVSNTLSVDVPKPSDSTAAGCSVKKSGQSFNSVQKLSMSIAADDCSTTGTGTDTGQKYAVFLLPDNSGGTIYIGQEETLKKLRTCDTSNGGLCDDPKKVYPPVKYVKESADFDTLKEAEAAACKAGKVEPGYWGTKLGAYGGHYWFGGNC